MSGCCKDEKADSKNDECGGHCGCCKMEETDLSSLGPEAIELAKLFEDVNSNLITALKIRKQILEMVHSKSAESDDMKEKISQVVNSRHPVLLQFVFGQ